MVQINPGDDFFRVGRDFESIKNYLNKNNFSDEVKESVFNLIKEDADGKITDNIELQKILGFMYKEGSVDMPSVVPDDKNVNVLKKADETILLNNAEKATYNINQKDRTATYSETTPKDFFNNEYQASSLVDKDLDGYADSSKTVIKKNGVITEYIDENLDGVFDKKQTKNENGEIASQVKSEDGRWILE